MTIDNQILTVKFYVVDGLSYVASETATGHFDSHGYVSMGLCRKLGFENCDAKSSMDLSDFVDYLDAFGLFFENTDFLNTDALDFYLSNSGFGVSASKLEIDIARAYFIDGLSLVKIEKKFGITEQKGFFAQYASTKLGAFNPKHKGSMSIDDFEERLIKLNLTDTNIITRQNDEFAAILFKYYKGCKIGDEPEYEEFFEELFYDYIAGIDISNQLAEIIHSWGDHSMIIEMLRSLVNTARRDRIFGERKQSMAKLVRKIMKEIDHA